MNNLADIIGRGFESRDLDYKGPCVWDEKDKKACCEIVKDILALANAGGGHLVIGVAETPSGFTPQGLSVEQAGSFESSRLNRFVQNYADPPINCVLTKPVDLAENVFVVVVVPSFTETPHICQKDYPSVLQAGTVYLRTDNNESAPVRSSSDMRRLVERAVRNKQDQLLESFRAILTSTTISSPNLEVTSLFLAQRDAAAATGEEATQYLDGSGQPLFTGYLELWSHPSTFRSDLLPLSRLREAARNADETFVGWPFLCFGQGKDAPHAISDGIEATVKFIDLEKRLRADFWQLRQSGFFYQRTLMWEEAQARMQGISPILDFRSFAIYTALGIRCLTKLYEGLFEESEPVSISVRINGAEGRLLLVHGGPFQRGRYIAKVPEIHLTEISSLADWRAGLVDHALSFCDGCFQRFNWPSPDLAACRKTIEDVLARRF